MQYSDSENVNFISDFFSVKQFYGIEIEYLVTSIVHQYSVWKSSEGNLIAQNSMNFRFDQMND